MIINRLAGQWPDADDERNQMQSVTLTAPKMSCGHCKMSIENAAGALEGVSSITADPDTKKVEVAYDENTVSLDAIKQAITAAGYPVE